MNALGRFLLNNPARALAQRHWVLPRLVHLGGRLDGCEALEIGCGRGVGAELLLDRFGVASLDAIDVDPAMVRLAGRRLGGRATVELADATDLGCTGRSYDLIVDLGALHLEPGWRQAIGEIHRVLRPGGRFCFEEIVGRRQALMSVATGRRIDAPPTRETLLAELRARGFEVIGLARPGPAVLTGMVGDLIGVAQRSG